MAKKQTIAPAFKIDPDMDLVGIIQRVKLPDGSNAWQLTISGTAQNNGGDSLSIGDTIGPGAALRDAWIAKRDAWLVAEGYVDEP